MVTGQQRLYFRGRFNAAVIAKAIEDEAVVEIAEKRDVVLEFEVGSPSAATTASMGTTTASMGTPTGARPAVLRTHGCRPAWPMLPGARAMMRCARAA
jgi:hypothetical protein